MKAAEIRKIFLDFFNEKQHKIVPSAPIVVKDDPTLMFTNAGMNQFKDYFLGNKEAKDKRATDTQKCLRVSGKQNDLEEVGVDTYHHTMFEMLGNWSFGDYFKKEAIYWAWELLTERYKLDKSRLYVTIFEGDSKDGVPEDTEAAEIWKELIDSDRILKCDKKDNFWEMGDTGPCGPCSEIHIDLRPQSEIDKISGKGLVNKDHEQVIEIWNLVFMQFNRMADGSLEDLPETHIDTGMGFERLVRAIQNKKSNYDTDVFFPLISEVSSKSGKIYGKDSKSDIAIRVLVDHVRALSFAIADGQLPSNTGAGYVIRRILRRAVRYAYTFLGHSEPFICKLVPILAQQMETVFPELIAQKDFVAKVIEEEEASFLRTLNAGIKRLDQVIASGDKRIKGEIVFELYDTYGFPYDLTALIAQENEITIDEEGFKEAMAKQKARARKASESEKGDWITVSEQQETVFLGYDHTEATVKISKYREVTEKKKTFYQIVLDQTPFYAEGGGQVGDKGRIVNKSDEILVFDTKRENDLIVHYCNALPKKIEAEFKAEIKTELRKATTLNHSSTHLLQAALQEVLGDHVAQKGSLVNPEILRFDFSHFSKVTEDEIEQIENLVNDKIRASIVLDEKREIAFDDAVKSGAMALFGEKYGEKVRMITFDSNFSVELCGGTHVQNTNEIGLFKIITETSVAAGVRRIEAYTGNKALSFLNDQKKVLDEVQLLLQNPKDILKSIQSLLTEKSDLQKKIEGFEVEQGKALKASLAGKVISKNGLNYIIDKVEAPNADSIKQIAYELRNTIDNLVFIVGAKIADKPLLGIMLSDNIVSEKDWHAGKMIKELAREIKGGGGGQPFFATAGGKNIEGLDSALKKAKSLVNLED